MSLKFDYIIPEINPILKDDGMDLWVTYKNKDWTVLSDLDVKIAKADSGKYFCKFCEGKSRTFYKSPREFFHEHLFQDFLDWSIKYISEDHYLAYIGKKKSWWCARIVNKRMALKMIDKDYLVAILSLKEKF